MTPMALAGTVRLWEQDRNPPRISWIHGAPIQQMSSPANSSWCNTNRVQVSTGMLTEGTNLQDTSLEPSFSVVEHYEGQTPAHSLVGAQHTHTHCQHTRKHLHAHTQQSVCSHPICSCERSVCHPDVRADHAHTHLHSHMHTPHHTPLLLFDTRREHMLPPQHAAGSLSCQANPGSCLALLFSLEGLCWDIPAPRV